MHSNWKSLAVALAFALVGCGGTPNPDAAGASVSSVNVAPASVSLAPGAQPVTFVALGGDDSTTWQLSASVGTLSAASGSSVQYTPPATLAQQTTVMLTASASGGARSSAIITLGAGADGGLGAAGGLAVAITLPAGAQASVGVFGVSAVQGDAGMDSYLNDGGWQVYAGTLTQSAVLNVPNGTYTVDAGYALLPDDIAGTLFWPVVTGAPATVTDPTTPAFISVGYYQPKVTSGHLWVASAATGVARGYSVAQIRAAAAHGTSLGNADLSYAPSQAAQGEAVAFDPHGNLWIADFQGAITGFLAPDFKTQVVIRGAGGLGFFKPSSIAFAPNGDLWVANDGNDGPGQLLRYTADQLLASGTPTPVAVIRSVTVAGTNSLCDTSDLAFDSHGTLWVVNSSNAAPIVGYANVGSLANNLAGADAGDIAPTTVLTDTTGPRTLSGLNGLSFDPAGNLWVATPLRRAVLRIDNAATATGTQPANIGVLLDDDFATDGGTLFSDVENLTFDGAGNLWVVNGSNNRNLLVEIGDPTKLNGALTPNPVLVVPGLPYLETGRIQFDPPADGIGLYR